MGLLDNFKKEKKQVIKKTADKKISEIKILKKDFSEIAYKHLKSPVITEKSTLLASKLNQYVFKISLRANKAEVKKSIQDLYGVKVNRVNIISIPGHKRRVGQHMGFKSGYRKAVVFLSPGETIDLV